MGVDRTDYLMVGTKIDPDLVDWDRDEAEIDGSAGAAFDLVYDGMSGKYAIAGRIIAKSDGHDAEEFHEVSRDALDVAPAVVTAVSERFPVHQDWRVYFFTHYH